MSKSILNNQPLLSVDVIPLRFNKKTLKLEAALGKRLYEPFVDKEALPGVLLLTGEQLMDAAKRALLTKTGFSPADCHVLRQIAAFDHCNRDPRGASISIAFLATLTKDAAENNLNLKARWHELPLTQILPFDHNAMIEAAQERLGLLLWQDWTFTKSLLGDVFSTSQAISLSQLLNALPTRASNMRRWLGESAYLQAADERIQQAGRFAFAWTWVN